ncbi:MAG: SLOG family protein [Oscillospiraceae bacterium]|nr:SLOG family protein [Oscillospiraceae bacterium]
MRTPEQMKELIIKVAEKDKRIRAVMLGGSRANADAPRDDWMDYDVGYVIDCEKSIKAMTKDLTWMDVLGDEVSVRITSAEKPDWSDGESYFILTQYADGTRIDLTFATVDAYHKTLESGDHGPAEIWLDKDGVFNLGHDNGLKYYVEAPDEKTYLVCCNEFWWIMPYVAKGLCRQEMSFAQTFLTHIREELVKALGWYVGMKNETPVTIGKFGKYLQKLLPPEIWREFAATYAGGEYPQMWSALFMAGELFGKVAQQVADHYGFAYPYKDEQRVTALLKSMQSDATKRIRATTCAFTGRRPQALPWGYDDGHPDARAFAKRISAEIERSYDAGYRNFICGMAQGVDLLACEQAILLKKTTCPELVLVAAIPGKDQTRNWPSEQIERYNACLKHCDVRRILSQFCNVETYHYRNRWMVDNASRLIAVWEGDPSGGTGRTVAYAESKGVDVVKIWWDEK